MKGNRTKAEKIKELLIEGKEKGEICVELGITNGTFNRGARTINGCEWKIEGALIDYSCIHDDPVLKLAEFKRDFKKRKMQGMLKELRDPYY